MKVSLFLACVFAAVLRPFELPRRGRRTFVVSPNYEDTSYLGDAGPLGLDQPVKKDSQI